MISHNLGGQMPNEFQKVTAIVTSCCPTCENNWSREITLNRKDGDETIQFPPAGLLGLEICPRCDTGGMINCNTRYEARFNQ